MSSTLFALSMAHAAPTVAGLLERAQLSGGVDARIYWKERHDSDAELHGVFLNYRKVFSDDLGDRWILSLQGDAEHDFEETRSYQSFLQYKGPLGKWNVRAGHFILPFGLLNDFDSERLLLQSNEEETLGIKLDTGVSAFGFVDDWDWFVSLTSGLGRRWIDHYENTYLTTFRVQRKLGGLTVGASFLVGETQPDKAPLPGEILRQRKLALDGRYDFGQCTARLEILFGEEEGDFMGGAQSFLDYPLSDVWELNFKASSIVRQGSEHELGMGVAFKPWAGWSFRAADLYRFEKGSNENEFRIQVSYEFSRGL